MPTGFEWLVLKTRRLGGRVGICESDKLSLATCAILSLMQGTPWEEMTAFAEKARRHAYAPYSKLQVGASVWAGHRIYAGCNIENASFGLTVCAERHALARAVAEGERPQALVVLAQTPQPILPCGACRQVLLELCAADLPIVCCTLSGERLSFQLGELLPFAFEKRFLPSPP